MRTTFYLDTMSYATCNMHVEWVCVYIGQPDEIMDQKHIDVATLLDQNTLSSIDLITLNSIEDKPTSYYT